MVGNPASTHSVHFGALCTPKLAGSRGMPPGNFWKRTVAWMRFPAIWGMFSMTVDKEYFFGDGTQEVQCGLKAGGFPPATSFFWQPCNPKKGHWRHHRKVCSSLLCVNTKSCALYGNPALKKNLMLNKGLIISFQNLLMDWLTSIALHNTCLASSHNWFMWWKDLCQTYQPQTTFQATLQKNRDAVFNWNAVSQVK